MKFFSFGFHEAKSSQKSSNKGSPEVSLVLGADTSCTIFSSALDSSSSTDILDTAEALPLAGDLFGKKSVMAV
jgi:hypothetical protein